MDFKIKNHSLEKRSLGHDGADVRHRNQPLTHAGDVTLSTFLNAGELKGWKSSCNRPRSGLRSLVRPIVVLHYVLDYSSKQARNCRAETKLTPCLLFTSDAA